MCKYFIKNIERSGSESAKICGSTDPGERGKKATKSYNKKPLI